MLPCSASCPLMLCKEQPTFSRFAHLHYDVLNDPSVYAFKPSYSCHVVCQMAVQKHSPPNDSEHCRDRFNTTAKLALQQCHGIALVTPLVTSAVDASMYQPTGTNLRQCITQLWLLLQFILRTWQQLAQSLLVICNLIHNYA